MNEDLQELMECVAMITAIGFGVEPKDAEAALPEITAEDRSFLHDNPNTDDIVEWVQHYASAAITADRAARAAIAKATTPNAD